MLYLFIFNIMLGLFKSKIFGLFVVIFLINILLLFKSAGHKSDVTNMSMDI